MAKRPIKFRAWDKHYECYIPTDLWAVVTTDFRAFGIMLKDWNNYREGEYFYENAQTLEQFTGLHDRNGKEIYIGDKIKDMLTLAEYEVKEGFCKRYAFTGIYCENFSQQKQLNADFDTDKNSQVEVIGNIHETKEDKS